MYSKLLTAAAALGFAAIAVAQPAEARGWRHHGFGWGAGALAAGVIGGAIVAGSSPYWGNGYYDGGPGYAPGYAYGPGYGYGPDETYGRAAAEDDMGAGPAMADGGSVAYCEAHFRSYDRASGTYMGYDGMRHSCP